MAAPAAAQDALSTARELYASAAYEEALAALDPLQGAGTPPVVLEQADQYRAFCLFALGRTADAELVVENLIKRNPMLELDAADASPRIAEMFTGIRRRLLPDLIRERYRMARTAIDHKDFSSAEPQLVQVQRMLDKAEEIDIANQGLADLRILVDGFLELNRALRANAETAEQPAAAAAAERTAPAVERVAAAAEQPAAEAVVSTASILEPRVVIALEDSTSDIVEPVAVSQDVPPIPPSLLRLLRDGPNRGVLELLIDELGNVERSTIRQSINLIYDEMLLRASRQWKYLPARNGQVPIKYLKTVAVVVQK